MRQLQEKKNVVPSVLKFLSREKENENNHVFQKDHRTSCNNCRIPKHRERQDNDHQCTAAMEKTPVWKMRKESDQTAWEKRKTESLATSGNLGKPCLFALPDLSRFMLPMWSNHHGSSVGSDRIFIYPCF